MVDWESAAVVALIGSISVFLVLGILSISVTISGNVIKSLDKRKTKEQAGIGS